MANSSFTIGTTGRFIRFLRHDDLENGVLKLADAFVDEFGDKIPLDVNMILPNGEIYNAKYDSRDKCIAVLDSMFDKYKKNSRLVLLLAFKLSGNFIVNVLNDGRSENEYDNRRRLLNEDDVLNGIGSKFFSLVIDEIIKDGDVDVPKSYMKKFGSKLPCELSLELNNGETFEISQGKSERRLHGLLQIYKKKYISMLDTLVFMYHGDGKFNLSIFGNEGIEKKFEYLDAIDIESDTEDGEYDKALVLADEYDDEDDRFFDVITTASHVDGRSHGMYIPKNVKPRGRQWNTGETVVLRTENCDCNVSLVNSSSTQRFSSGWNRFVREIVLKQNDTLHFGIVADDENGVVFSVEILPSYK